MFLVFLMIKFSQEENRKLNISCINPKNFKRLCQMMHLRVANMVKFKLDETRNIKLRSHNFKKILETVKITRWMSPKPREKRILNTENKFKTTFPMLSPKRNIKNIEMNVRNNNKIV